MLMRLHMEIASRRFRNVSVKSSVFFAVALSAVFQAFFCQWAEAAITAPIQNQKWVISKNRVLRCIDIDGKTILTFKRGIPTYKSELPEIPPDYRSINFIVLDKGASAAVFDYNNGGTTVTFYLGGCLPSRTHSYPDLELYTFSRELKSGLGLVVALANVDRAFSEDFDRSGHFVQWDSSGTEKMKAGPFRFPDEGVQFEMFQGERYGEHDGFDGRQLKHTYFDFSKGATHEYVPPGDTRGWTQNITPDGVLRFYQLVGRKTEDGKILSIEEFQSLPLPEFQRIEKSSEPQYRLVHEHRF